MAILDDFPSHYGAFFKFMNNLFKIEISEQNCSQIGAWEISILAHFWRLKLNFTKRRFLKL